MLEIISETLINIGIKDVVATHLANLIAILIIIIVSMTAKIVANKLVHGLLSHHIKNNNYKWDNIMLKRKVFSRIANIIPAVIIYMSAGLFPDYKLFIEKLMFIYIVIIISLVIDSFLTSLNDIYNMYEVSKTKPVKGFLQVAKIVLYVFATIIILAHLMGESPVIILSGIGALAAVLMLVFKDSLLSLVAGIQIIANDMIRIGDWVEMPKYDAGGDVIDMSLNIIKIRNFDKTITTVPTYAFVSDSFKNWRGIEEVGGRRIKRSINIDANSIRVCDLKMLEKLMNIKEIKQYIEDYQKKDNEISITNIELFQMYILNYLNNHNQIHKDMTQMARQLEPTEHGVPLEIYAFTNDINWVNYENIQTEIFSHLIAIINDFDLRIYQSPTGHDLKMVLQKNNVHI